MELIDLFPTGLSPIQKGTPWPIQSAFVSAVLYFFIVKDRDGFIGIAVRNIVGDLSANTVSTIIVAMQVLTLSSQVIFDHPDANFLVPVHRFVYYISNLQGPPAASKAVVTNAAPASEAPPKLSPGLRFRKFVITVRLISAVLLGIYLLSLRIPPVSLPAVAQVEVFQQDGAPHVTLHTVSGGLTTARAVGNCQWVQLLPFAAPQCAPHLLRLEEHFVCANDTCGAATSAVDALQRNVISNLKFRLAVHPIAGAPVGMPSQIQTASQDDLYAINSNLEWATSLPLEITSAAQLRAAEPQYALSSVSLHLSQAGELYLVSNAQFSGTIFDPARLTGRLLWSGLPAVTCANKAAEDAQAPPGSSVEAEALYLDASSGAPRIRCSDGTSVELAIGEVYKPRAREFTQQSTPAPAPVEARSAKAEL